ncbi:MAG: ExeM/NucH family extracellular endonuclease, partial [Rothia sp. (in: high G+C Gram-positive bacteria)]|nr:ExeM/NucH family extracellular endonuclease [Rothia sp. (in: high G+C Gram-positive bacteria)]
MALKNSFTYRSTAPVLAAALTLLPFISAPVYAAETTSIAAIQGEGAVSPLNGKTVTTRGVVTAVYPEGGIRGYYIQTEGTGGDASRSSASDGIFIYSPSTVASVSQGQFLEVTGTVSEHQGQTQIAVTQAADMKLLAEPFTPISPVTEALPEDETGRESLEGMLVQPTGPITVTDNYNTNRYGEIGLVNGTQPLRTATDVIAPGADAIAYEANNAAKAFVLDDGATIDYTRGGKDVPLPYLSEQPPLRVGAQLTFTHPVVLSYSFDAWRLQPTSQITGASDPAALPATWTNTRSAAPALTSPQTASSFNVLNYFTTLGDTVAGCKFYTDRANTPITVSGSCAVRGAATLASFERQESKIVKAINAIDTSVLSLEEIENSLVTGGKDRDEALNTLVAALNEDAGYQKWAAVPSPSVLPTTEDVIRTAFIYQPAEVKPVGESEILDSPAFANARQPLAQVFAPVNATMLYDDEVFVAIVNHFKSKGSGSGKNADQGDGQGASNADRVAQAKALIEFAHEQQEEAHTHNVLLLGDFNSYTQEDPMRLFYKAGYTNLGEQFGAGNTYLHGGRVGSLDHILASPSMTQKVTEAQVWNVNSTESIAHEYSRYNYNVSNLYENNEFRSSDHDPVLVGFTMPSSHMPSVSFVDVPASRRLATE